MKFEKYALLSFLAVMATASGITAVAAPGSARQDPPATHGMLVLGHAHVYLSHLPMYHRPHDFQAVFEAELPPAAKEAYLSNLKLSVPKTRAETIFTLVPEPFVLTDLLHGPAVLKAVLYRGHFERGGEPITGTIPVRITRVVYFQKLDPSAPHPDAWSGFLFGSPEEPFVAHHVTGGPNFDQLLLARVGNPDVLALLRNHAWVPLSAPALSDQSPVNEGTFDATVPKLGLDAPLSVRPLYLETDDLSH